MTDLGLTARERLAVDRLRSCAVGVLWVLCCGAPAPAWAARLVSVATLDKDTLVVNVRDGEVIHRENGTETVNRFAPELSTASAVLTASWTLKSSVDASYGGTGQHPTACWRKTKLNGHAQLAWNTGTNDYNYESTFEHWVFLRLPSSLQQGMTYTLEIAAATNLDTSSAPLTFDIYSSRSEAVHVNLVGYLPDAPHKAADLYQWMGDGGARDYGSFVGNKVYVYALGSKQAVEAGQVKAWKPSGSDVGGYNLTRSAVWNADFTPFTTSGTYRLVVDGVGCSQDFTIAADVYAEPFRISLRGFSYMRLGQATPLGVTPPYRTPLLKPGIDPPNTTVYLTTVQPFDANWSSIPSDPWDHPDSFARFRKVGNPTNPNAWGGHADAADRDRHLGHVSIIYDMLLPYILSRGALSDDASGIPESGNGIPDVIDEAAYEVDFWLRLRDGEGYGHGLTNPNNSNVLYQAGTNAVAAWANAANAAMLAEAYRIAGETTRMATYRDAAVAAYTYANGLADPMLDRTQDVGNTVVRGRDLKMTAAAYLYNLTGDQAYEAVVNAESVCTGTTAQLDDGGHNQIWATAGYLFTPQPVHFATLQGNMRASAINDAKVREANLTLSRPSRRATDERAGYFHTSQNVQRTMLALAVATAPADRDLFRKALALEADWGLGRNSLNMIQMGTATTALAARRSVDQMYTSGRDDGVPGIDPGHTPYMNLNDWDGSMVMGSPSRLYANAYPANFTSSWPIAEGYFNTPWVWAHSEFTPQQSMRGKTALYGYLHALGASAPTRALAVAKAGAGSGTVTSAPAAIDCGTSCIASFARGSSVTLTAAAATGSAFAGWGSPCSGTGSCTLAMDADRVVTATFDTTAPGTFPLAVRKAGSGSGTVTSAPTGIACGSACSASYANGTPVTLTAAAASGATFAGWSGACSGSGACSITMGGAQSVTATFDAGGSPGDPKPASVKAVTGCGCGAGGAGSLLALAAGLGLLPRRRRR